MDTFLQAIRNIGAVRLVIMGGLIAGLVGFFMIVMAWFLLVTEYRFVGKVQEWLQRMTRRE